jgi:hypothetical protein
MRNHISFCVVLFFFISHASFIDGQQRAWQIVINAGEGYSPEFDGDISLFSSYPWYPVGTILGVIDNPQSNDYPSDFSCTSITPNIGGTVDVGVMEYFSIGIASSYQSEVANWIIINRNFPLPPNSFPNSDRITRINIAVRLLAHMPVDWTSKYLDTYAGIRLGESRWHDIPSSDNMNYPYYYSQTKAYFINKSDRIVPSFQGIIGLRFFPIYNLGIHVEIGIGSPYLVEGGVTFRIDTLKKKEKKN